MRVVVTGIGWNGTIRRTAVDPWCLTELDRWEGIIEMVLACPPEYRAAPGRAVYVIHPVTAQSWWARKTSPARWPSW